MPFQNRVTPFGDIVAIEQRGLLTGNRGIIHDPVTKTLSGRRWTTRSWIICSCDYKGRRREIMGGRSWTELFFLESPSPLQSGIVPAFSVGNQRLRPFALRGPQLPIEGLLCLRSTQSFIGSGWNDPDCPYLALRTYRMALS